MDVNPDNSPVSVDLVKVFHLDWPQNGAQGTEYNPTMAKKPINRSLKVIFLFEKLFEKSFSSSSKTFNALVKLNGEYIFQNLLGRKFWVIISSEFIALPQARSPVKTPPGAPFLNITIRNWL